MQFKLKKSDYDDIKSKLQEKIVNFIQDKSNVLLYPRWNLGTP